MLPEPIRADTRAALETPQARRDAVQTYLAAKLSPHLQVSEDEVMVSVVPREGVSLSEASLIEHCRDNMAYFMVPRFVEIVSELPKTMTEKVEKYKLRQAAEARLGQIWDREKACRGSALLTATTCGWTSRDRSRSGQGVWVRSVGLK